MFCLMYHAHAFGTMNKPFEAPQVLGFCSSVSRLTRVREAHDRSMSLRARVSAAPWPPELCGCRMQLNPETGKPEPLVGIDSAGLRTSQGITTNQ